MLIDFAFIFAWILSKLFLVIDAIWDFSSDY